MIINKIYNEDCLATMDKMPNNFIDLTVTSPPYNMNLRIRNGKYCSRQIVKEFSNKYKSFDDNMPIDDYYNLHSSILKQLIRVSKIVFYNIQIVTGSKRAFFKIIGEFSNQLKEIIIWDKVNSQPSMSVGVLNRQSELILVFEKENAISRKFSVANFNRGSCSDVWKIKRGAKPSDIHGAVFPEELASFIISKFSNEGDLVYDPFIGSGTTAVCCKKHNRKYIGSELSKEYCDIANQRISNI